MRLHVLVRFGRWQEIIDEPLPADPVLYCTTTAMLHYAKGVAHAALGDVAAASEQRRLFRDAVARVPDTRYLFNNTCLDILAVAAEMLDGEIAYRSGDFDEAFAHLRRAVELDDNLPYDEPWGWMQPARHALGALLLEQGRVRGGRGRLPRRPRPRRHAPAPLPAPGQRLEPARLPRVPDAARQAGRGGRGEVAARRGAGRGDRAHRGLVLLPRVGRGLEVEGGSHAAAARIACVPEIGPDAE